MQTLATGSNSRLSISLKTVFRLTALFFCVVLVPTSVFSSDPLMVEGNLFSPDRKKPLQNTLPGPPPPEAARDKPPTADGAIRLKGVLFYSDRQRALLDVNSALIKIQDNKRRNSSSFWVGPGEMVGPFEVVRMDSRSVTLARGEEILTLELLFETPSAPARKMSAGEHHTVASQVPPVVGAPLLPHDDPDYSPVEQDHTVDLASETPILEGEEDPDFSSPPQQ